MSYSVKTYKPLIFYHLLFLLAWQYYHTKWKYSAIVATVAELVAEVVSNLGLMVSQTLPDLSISAIKQS